MILLEAALNGQVLEYLLHLHISRQGCILHFLETTRGGLDTHPLQCACSSGIPNPGLTSALSPDAIGCRYRRESMQGAGISHFPCSDDQDDPLCSISSGAQCGMDHHSEERYSIKTQLLKVIKEATSLYKLWTMQRCWMRFPVEEPSATFQPTTTWSGFAKGTVAYTRAGDQRAMNNSPGPHIAFDGDWLEGDSSLHHSSASIQY